MKPAIFLRIASGLTLLHSILHTIGGVFGSPGPGVAAATEAVMRANYFPAFGQTRSYWEFYRGMGLGVTIFLTAEGLVFWLLASIAKKDAAQLPRSSGYSRWRIWSSPQTPMSTSSAGQSSSRSSSQPACSPPSPQPNRRPQRSRPKSDPPTPETDLASRQKQMGPGPAAESHLSPE